VFSVDEVQQSLEIFSYSQCARATLLTMIVLAQRTSLSERTQNSRDSFVHNSEPRIPNSNPDIFDKTLSPWVVFTATERAYQPPPFHTPALLQHGSRPPQSKLLTRSASSQRRAQPHHKSVSSSEILTVLLRSRSLLVCQLQLRAILRHDFSGM
jgi:hypothetical protein